MQDRMSLFRKIPFLHFLNFGENGHSEIIWVISALEIYEIFGKFWNYLSWNGALRILLSVSTSEMFVQRNKCSYKRTSCCIPPPPCMSRKHLKMKLTLAKNIFYKARYKITLRKFSCTRLP